MNRRTLLSTTAATATSFLLLDGLAAQPTATSTDSIPQRGETWNESVVFPDEATTSDGRWLLYNAFINGRVDMNAMEMPGQGRV